MEDSSSKLDLKEKRVLLEKEAKKLSNIMHFLSSQLEQTKANLTKVNYEVEKVYLEEERNKQPHKVINPNKLPRPKKTVVTDHALVRFFERVLGYNISEVSSWLFPPELQRIVAIHGDGVYQSTKHKIVVKNNTIVTILGADQKITHYKNCKPARSFRAKGKRRLDDTEELLNEYYEQEEDN